MSSDPPKPLVWPHAPPHFLAAPGTYFVTCSTLRKIHHNDSPERLDQLTQSLFERANEFGWQLESWACFSNHYHIIAKSPAVGGASLSEFMRQHHIDNSTFVNELDGTPGRQVWFNYWDTHLTFEKSYLARLNYVNNNPVKHGLVRDARDYPWCSAAWFEKNASPAFHKTVSSFKTDKLNIEDDF